MKHAGLWVDEPAETVLEQVQDYIITGWPYGGTWERPSGGFGGAPGNTVTVATLRGIFPRTWYGWAFNITMTILSLGSWLAVWLLWILVMAGEPYIGVSVSAVDTSRGTKVVVEGKGDEWFSTMFEFLSRRLWRHVLALVPPTPGRAGGER